MTARLYECRITHARTVPLRNVFTYRTYLWLVDLDQLPDPGWPAPGCWPGSRPATISATRAAASGRTSTTSWPRTASTWAAAG